MSAHQLVTAGSMLKLSDPNSNAASEVLLKLNVNDKINTTLKFDQNLTVEEACSRVLLKYQIKNPSSYGMFLQTPDNKSFLLDETQTLCESRLKDNVSPF